MSSCSGCFPIYQENQLAHCEVGGCMHIEEMELCEPVNLESRFDLVADKIEQQKSEPLAKVYREENNECVICYDVIGVTNNCVTPCGHAFCFKCLMSAMILNNTCPCCRTELFVVPSDNLEEDNDDDDDDENFSDEEDESEDGDPEEVPVETITARLQANGFTMLDIVSMMTNNYSKTDPKYTFDFISKMNNKYDEILEEVDKEFDEQRKFAAEDGRV
jgi:hypothetical protein